MLIRRSLFFSDCFYFLSLLFPDVDDELKIAQYRRFNKPPTRKDHEPSYTQEEFDARRNHWYAESPPFKSGNKLRDYQIEGLNFLIKAWYDDRNTILADEMGSVGAMEENNEHKRKNEQCTRARGAACGGARSIHAHCALSHHVCLCVTSAIRCILSG